MTSPPRAPGRIAVIGGGGRLPGLLVEALAGADPVLAEMAGFPFDGAGEQPVERFRIERLVPFLDRLRALGVGRVVMAGRMARPALDPAALDPGTAALVPRLMAAMAAGDDTTLRMVVALFEEAGFAVIGAADIRPDLVPGAGVLGAVAPDARAEGDAARAADIVAALGAVDVGQGAVVAGGLCLGLEALPGTDVMLAQVAALPGAGRGGVLFKAPKPGQEMRVDMPALGPDTVQAAAAAGLAGIAWAAGGVMLIDRAAAVAAADAAGLFLWSREATG